MNKIRLAKHCMEILLVATLLALWYTAWPLGMGASLFIGMDMLSKRGE